MKNGLGYTIGFGIKRSADTLAVGTVNTINTIGDGVTGFFRDIGSGFKRAKATGPWTRTQQRNYQQTVDRYSSVIIAKD